MAHTLATTISILLTFLHHLHAGLLTQPVTNPAQPIKPGDYSTPNTVPAFPTQSTESQQCHLDLSDELFGGVTEACGHSLDRSRCCPVLAAWLYAAHARSALQLPAQAQAQPPISPESDSELQPMMPDSDSQTCVNSLHNSLQKRNIILPQPNSTCDTVLCFCNIRLHQIASLSCPLAFNLTASYHNGTINTTALNGTTTSSYRNATPTAAVKNLEKNCRNSSYAGCTKCLGALEKLKGGDKNGTTKLDGRASKMFKRDCQLMGLTWLLARNKTAYIPTVSAVLRAMMYSAHPHQSKCSPDQENMPLAVDSLQFYKDSSSAVTSRPSIDIIILSSFLPFILCMIMFDLFGLS